MANTTETIPSFLKDALNTYAQYSATQKQDAQKRALKWLQSQIESELSTQNILEQFAQKWRVGTAQLPSVENDPIYLENLPGSYKGDKSISQAQEDALVFLQENVPAQMQSDFKTRWDVKKVLKVSSKTGTIFKIDEREPAVLQQEDPDGNGTSWYPLKYEQLYYVLSHEEKGEHFLVTLSEDIGSQNQNTWFVSTKDVQISNI